MFVCIILLLLLLHQIDFSGDDKDHCNDDRDTSYFTSSVGLAIRGSDETNQRNSSTTVGGIAFAQLPP